MPYLHRVKGARQDLGAEFPQRATGFDQDAERIVSYVSDKIDPAAAAVLTDMNTARIFVFGLGQVISAEEVKARKFIE